MHLCSSFFGRSNNSVVRVTSYAHYLVKGGHGMCCAFIVTRMERHYTPMIKSAQLILITLHLIGHNLYDYQKEKIWAKIHLKSIQ